MVFSVCRCWVALCMILLESFVKSGEMTKLVPIHNMYDGQFGQTIFPSNTYYNMCDLRKIIVKRLEINYHSQYG